MRKKILLVLGAAALLLFAVNFRWVKYLIHLARHQAKVVLFKESITERLKKSGLGERERIALENTLKIRSAIENLYGVKNSSSYTSYYDLGREALGYNITVAPALSFQLKAFHFWPIGSFEYLGFFDKAYAEAWAKKYRDQGYDVYISEIGGYSTLGWFEDPLYSSQLAWGNLGLAYLLAHEIAHEKLYFKNDTEFSEMLAAFIERKAAPDALRLAGLPPSATRSDNKRRRLEIIDRLLALRLELDALYKSQKSDAYKLKEKTRMIHETKTFFEKRKKDYNLKEPFEINNASLSQLKRYTPRSQSFENVFKACEKKDNSQKYPCWFSEIEKLKVCDKKARQAWLKETNHAEGAVCFERR